jgi:hypothetical protein
VLVVERLKNAALGSQKRQMLSGVDSRYREDEWLVDGSINQLHCRDLLQHASDWQSPQARADLEVCGKKAFPPFGLLTDNIDSLIPNQSEYQ